MVGLIIGVIISLAIIAAGLSGSFVLRGTDSSLALVAVGVVFLLVDLFKIVAYVGEKKRAEQQRDAQLQMLAQHLTEEQTDEERMAEQQVARRQMGDLPASTVEEGSKGVLSVCPACYAVIEPRFKFCVKCGQPVAMAPPSDA